MPAHADPHLPEQRVVEAAARLPVTGAVSGWAALRLSGAAYFDGLAPDRRTLRPVLLATGDHQGRRQVPGVQWRYGPLEQVDLTTRHGVPVTTPARAVFDEMRLHTDWREAVVAMDMAAAARLVSVRQLVDYHAERTAWDHAARVSRVLGLCHEESRSPTETRMRLVWVVDAGLPPPAVNQPVFDRSGALICVADLFDEEAGLVVEYDGADHRTARRHARDVRRAERCRRAGLEYCTIVSADLGRPAIAVERFHSTRARSLFLPPSRRAWTLDPPAWWRPEDSLDDERAMSAWLSEQVQAERDWRPPDR